MPPYVPYAHTSCCRYTCWQVLIHFISYPTFQYCMSPVYIVWGIICRNMSILVVTSQHVMMTSLWISPPFSSILSSKVYTHWIRIGKPSNVTWNPYNTTHTRTCKWQWDNARGHCLCCDYFWYNLLHHYAVIVVVFSWIAMASERSVVFLPAMGKNFTTS